MLRQMPFFALLLDLGCARQATSATPKASDTAEPDSGASASADEALLRAAIRGEVDAHEALQTINLSGGLPVQTVDGNWLFACLCGQGEWMLAGDHEGWQGQPMERAGQLSWIEVQIADPDMSLYKFTDSSEWTADPMARRYGYDSYGEYSLVWATDAHLERWSGVEGQGLAPRALHVWVPQDGEFTHTLFAHDGQNLFDPQAMWGGWRLEESVPDEMLVVGIENTADRMEEYTHTTDTIHGTVYGGEGDAYAALVEDGVRPLIESAYGEASVTGTMGSSLGGLISFYIAHVYEDRYDMAISLSGTMGWGSIGANNPTMIELYAAAGHRSTALYLDSGGNGGCLDSDGDGTWDDDPDSADNYCENLQLAEVLAGNGYQYEDDLWHWHEPGAEHNEAEWAARVWRPLEIFADRQ